MNEEQTRQLLGDRFRVDKLLGSGSFGNTYAAVDTTTGESLAVKELDLSHVDDWKVIELFEREARTLERLDHRGIPNYVDFIPARADQSAYLAQELAPGSPLSHLLDAQGHFDEGRAKKIAAQLLEILEYLESCRPPVIHRDIKPSNILADGDDRIYLVDFGSVVDVARRSSSRGSTVAGTFGYMAPEQLHGEATIASDLYATGMTLIHLVTGRAPEGLPKARMKIQFRDAAPHLTEHFAKFIETLGEPAIEDRFRRPSEALEFLENPPPAGQALVARPHQNLPEPTQERFARAVADPLYEQALRHEPEVPNMVGLVAGLLAAGAIPLLAVPIFLIIVFPEFSWILLAPFAAIVAVAAIVLVFVGRRHNQIPTRPLLVTVLDTSPRQQSSFFPLNVTIEASDGSRGRFDAYEVVDRRMIAPGDVGVGYIRGDKLIDFIKIDV